MLLAPLTAILLSNITLPPKPPMIRASEYDQVLKFARIGEKGNTVRSLIGLRAMLLDGGITVAVDPSIPKERQSDAVVAIDLAVKHWNQWLGEKLFRYTSKVESANLKVSFANYLNRGFEQQCLGQINFKRELKISPEPSTFTVSGSIQVIRRQDGNTLDSNQIGEVITHELGHMLGLDDTTNATGIMGTYEKGKPRQLISREELESLVLYRGIISAVVGRISTLDKN
jgi:hypothetical protein